MVKRNKYIYKSSYVPWVLCPTHDESWEERKIPVSHKHKRVQKPLHRSQQRVQKQEPGSKISIMIFEFLGVHPIIDTVCFTLQDLKHASFEEDVEVANEHRREGDDSDEKIPAHVCIHTTPHSAGGLHATRASQHRAGEEPHSGDDNERAESKKGDENDAFRPRCEPAPAVQRRGCRPGRCPWLPDLC